MCDARLAVPRAHVRAIVGTDRAEALVASDAQSVLTQPQLGCLGHLHRGRGQRRGWRMGTWINEQCRGERKRWPSASPWIGVRGGGRRPGRPFLDPPDIGSMRMNEGRLRRGVGHLW